MSEDLATRPAIETILERVNALGKAVNSIREDIKSFGQEIRGEIKDFREEIRGEVEGIREENKLFRAGVELSIDRIEGMTSMTRSDMLAMRMDFREMRAQARQTD